MPASSLGRVRCCHASPALFAIDGNGVEAPLGFHADRLGMDIHVVTADTPPIRNLDLAVRSAHLNVRTMVASPVAASYACLVKEERDLGVALVEIGAGVTNIAVYVMGQLIGVATVPMGAGDITNDIAAAFATKRIHAERAEGPLRRGDHQPEGQPRSHRDPADQ